jgi:hypothetical protein
MLERIRDAARISEVVRAHSLGKQHEPIEPREALAKITATLDFVFPEYEDEELVVMSVVNDFLFLIWETPERVAGLSELDCYQLSLTKSRFSYPEFQIENQDTSTPTGIPFKAASGRSPRTAGRPQESAY